MKEFQDQRVKLLERLEKQLKAEIFTNTVRLALVERDALYPEELSETELIAILVRSCRLLRGWTEAELARRSGVTFETVSRVENAKHRPHKMTVEKLAQAFEVPPKQLDPEVVFARWPAVYQTVVTEREVLDEQMREAEEAATN